MMRYIGTIGLACLCLASLRADQGMDSTSKVKASLSTSTPDKNGKQTLSIALDIEEGWYLYANPTKANKAAEDIVGENQTRVTFSANGKKVEAKIMYPEGVQKTEVISKDEEARWHIYQKKATIICEIHRTPDVNNITAEVFVNACLIGANGRTVTCLPQGKIVVKVP